MIHQKGDGGMEDYKVKNYSKTGGKKWISLNNYIKLLLSFIVIISMSLIPIITNATTEVIIVDPTPDTTPPVLNSLSISAREATPGSTIYLSAEASDDLSGVDRVYLYYRKPSGSSQIIYFSLSQITQRYEGNIKLNEYSESGIWILSSIYIDDKKGNTASYSSYSPPNGIDLSTYSIQVIGSEDITPPTINDISISQSQATVGSRITVLVDATDDLSGIHSGNAYFRSPSGKNKSVYFGYNQASGKYEGSMTIDQYDEVGTWKLNIVQFSDKTGNSKSVYNLTLYNSSPNSLTQEYRDLSACNVEVTGTTPDLLGPTLDSLGISLVNGPAVRLTADFSDNLTNLGSLSARYRKPSGKYYHASFSRNNTTAKYELSIPIDKYDELGTWKLESIQMNDSKGNYRSVVDNLSGSGIDAKDFSPFHFIVRGVITIPPLSPFSIGVSPKKVKLEAGNTQQLRTTLNMSDGTTQDITSGSTGTIYSSSNPSAVKVGTNGLITVEPSASPGTVYVQAVNGGLHAQCEVTIPGGTPESHLQINPLDIRLATGQSKQLNVIASLADGTVKDVTLGSTGTTYSSSDTTRVSVNQNGLIQVLAEAREGTVTIRADHNGIAGESVVTVTGPPTVRSLAMAPDTATVAAGETIQLSVRATMTDGSSKEVTVASGTVYTTSNGNRAIVDADGLVSVPSNATSGTVTVKAMNNGSTVQCVVTVIGLPTVNSIEISPSTQTLIPGETLQISTMAAMSDGSTKDITAETSYSSSNPNVATVDANGLISIPSAATSGVAYIRGTYAGKGTAMTVTVPATASVTGLSFTPGSATLAGGETLQISAMAAMSDGSTKDVTTETSYSSSNPNVATVDDTGLISIPSTAASGTAYIRGTYAGKGAATTVTVNIPVISVSSLTMTPSNLEREAGATYQISTMATLIDGNTKDVTAETSYSSSNPSVATVDANGLITVSSTATSGTAYIRGSYGGKGTAVVVTIPVPATITSLSFTPSSQALRPGDTLQVNAIARMSDGSTKDVTAATVWSSSNTNLARVDANGLVRIPDNASNGTVYIRGTYNGKGAATTITITAPTFSSLRFNPSTMSLNQTDIGTTKQITAEAVMSDGSTVDVTGSTAWSSSNTNVATVDANGQVRILSAGTVHIRGTYNGKGAATTITITAPTFSSLRFSPSTMSLNQTDIGTIKQITAEAVMSDGSTVDVTGSTAWSSSNTNVATVDANGQVTILSAGTVHIRGTYNGKGAATTITITN